MLLDKRNESYYLDYLFVMNLFLDAARGRDTERAPVWIMRQAGRYLPEYRALKERYSFWELVRTPDLAVKVTMHPVERFQLDAAILFSDIMTPLPAMGIEIDFVPGPVIESPIRSAATVESLRIPHSDEIAPFVADTISCIRDVSPVPLIGFAGAPLTLAAYLIQGSGSKDFAEFRGLLRSAPEIVHTLLEKLSLVTSRYLQMQVRAGAQAVQLFDSWAGLLDAKTYAQFAAPYNQQVLESLASLNIPRTYFTVNGGHLYNEINSLSCEVVGVDWRHPLDHVRPQLRNKVLQGNLDPAELLGPRNRLIRVVQNVLQAGLGGPHIFNLGHGILRQTNPDKLHILLDTVRAFKRHGAEQTI